MFKRELEGYQIIFICAGMPKLSIIVRGPQIISEENWTKSRHPSECDSKLLVVIFIRACGTSLSPGIKTYFSSHIKASRYIHMLLLVDYLSLKQDLSKGFIGQNRWYLSELLLPASVQASSGTSCQQFLRRWQKSGCSLKVLDRVCIYATEWITVSYSLIYIIKSFNA